MVEQMIASHIARIFMRPPSKIIVLIGGVVILCIVPLLIVHLTKPTNALRFDHTRYDFGTVYHNTVVKHSFPFRNAGKRVLVIHSVRKSCGCLKATVTVNRLLPNERGEIEVEYASSEATGVVKQSVVVSSNDSDNPYIRLEFTAQVVTDIIVQPACLAFGRVLYGTESTQRIEVKDGGAGIMRVEKIVSNDPLVTVSEFKFNEHERAGFYSAIVRLSPRIPLGYYSSRVEILTNIDSRKEIEIPVSAVIHGNVTVSPESIQFGVVNKWSPPVPHIVLIDSSKKECGIEKVTADADTEASFVELISGSNRRFSVTVQLKSHVAIGAIKGEVLIETNDPIEKSIRIPYSAIIQDDSRT
jgi:hypothetical protein